MPGDEEVVAAAAVRPDNRAPPSWNSNVMSYDAWRFEVQLWDEWTEVPKARRGRLVMVALPINDASGAREKIRLAVQTEELKLGEQNSVENILLELDKSFKKDDLSRVCDVWTEFIKFKRNRESMQDYINNYEQKINSLKREKITLPDVVVAMQLLSGSDLERRDKQIVLTAVDYNKTNELFSQMKMALRKFYGENTSVSQKEPNYAVIKEESANFTGYRGRGYYPRRGRPFQSQGNAQRFQSNRGSTGVNNRGRSQRRSNPKDYEGNIMKCTICESIFHFRATCPDSYENRGKEVHYTESEDRSDEGAEHSVQKVMDFSMQEDQQILMCEAANTAVLDSACTKTVTGTEWKNIYLESLSPADRAKVKQFPGGTNFKFGGETKLKSYETLHLPATIAGKQVTIATDVVDSNIPLLLSKPDMKKFGMTLNLEDDTAKILGRQIDLETTTSGHYCIPLIDSEVPIETVQSVINEKSDTEKMKILTKLHRQFAHPTAKNLVALIKNAEDIDTKTVQLIEMISENCLVCKRYKKTPSRPVVCLPLSKHFNDVVAMDLKLYKPGIYFIHLIDLHTRFSLAKVIKRKLPSVIIDSVIGLWIANGLGAPNKFLIDNGGEFCNSLYKEMAEQFNVEICTTGAESPWSNGICERNHAVVDSAVEKMIEDDPTLGLDTALAWAINAKNAISNHNGFSSYQLVYGQNPNLPSVLNDKLPALEGTVSGESTAKHLNALHAARKAFVKVESGEKIRRALRHQVRAVENHFEAGDKVFYKRDDSNRWRGPGKVIGQDHKIVFVRHADQIVRVSTCRLVKVGQEFNHNTEGKMIKEAEERHISRISKEPDDDNFADDDNENTMDNNEHPREDDEPNQGHNQNIPRENDREIIIERHEEMVNDPHASKRLESAVKFSNKQIDAGVLIRYRVPEKVPEEWLTAKIVSRGGKTTGENRNYYNIEKVGNGEQLGVNLEKVEYQEVKPTENEDTNGEEAYIAFVPIDRHQEPDVKEAKRKEIESWIEFGVFSEVDDNPGLKTISTRWVVTEKVMPDGKRGAKARLVVRGFEEIDPGKSDSPTAAKATLRTFLAIASNEGWACESIDIKAAFLQGKAIERDIFVKPPKDLLKPGVIWKLNKVVYGLDDAARNWYFSVKEELIRLKCQQSVLDQALFRFIKGQKLEGIFLLHVDDFLCAGTDRFKKDIVEAIGKRFKVGKRQNGSFRYIGLDLTQNSDRGGINMNQNEYIQEMRTIELSQKRRAKRESFLNEQEIKEYRGVVGQINWVSSQTRPDATFDMLSLSMQMKHPQVENAIEANKVVRKLKSAQSGVTFRKLGLIENLKIVVYCDASWGNLPDGHSSAGGYLILLVGVDYRCCPLDWSATKIKRVVHSTLAAEALAMLESMDNAIYLANLINEMYKNEYNDNKIPIEVYTDNQSLKDNLQSTKQVSEKRLRINIAEIREQIESKSISKIEWIPSRLQMADGLTKKGVAVDSLLNIFNKGKLDE